MNNNFYSKTFLILILVSFSLVVNAENKVETAQVEIGKKIPGYTIIKSGVKSGDQIILEGLQKAKPGMEVIPIITDYKLEETKQ